MSKHTPGPWTFRDNAWNKEESKYDFAYLIGNEELELKVGEIGFSGDRDRNLADRNLILAAPDMLKVLEELVNNYGKVPQINPIRKEVLVIIKKIRGIVQ